MRNCWFPLVILKLHFYMLTCFLCLLLFCSCYFWIMCCYIWIDFWRQLCNLWFFIFLVWNVWDMSQCHYRRISPCFTKETSLGGGCCLPHRVFAWTAIDYSGNWMYSKYLYSKSSIRPKKKILDSQPHLSKRFRIYDFFLTHENTWHWILLPYLRIISNQIAI